MCVTLRHGGIAVAKYFLHVIERPAAVNQERCVVVPKVMQAQEIQARLRTQSVLPAVYRCERLASTAYEGMIKFIPCAQAFQDLDRGPVQRNAPDLARLAVL